MKKIYITWIYLLLAISTYAQEEIILSFISVNSSHTYDIGYSSSYLDIPVSFSSSDVYNIPDIYIEQMNQSLMNHGYDTYISVSNISYGTLTIKVAGNSSTSNRVLIFRGVSGGRATINQAGSPPPPEPEPEPDSDEKLSIPGNWILTRTYTRADNATRYQDITFYNGLGYPEQVINVGASSGGKNIVTPIVYDAMLRGDAKTYLPYASTNSTPLQESASLATQANYYNALYGAASNGYSYLEKVYEPSSLNRPLQQYNAGSVFRDNGKKTTFGYAANAANEVFKLDVSGSTVTVGYYPAATLYKNTLTNEDGQTVITYTDLSGRTVLERKVASGINHDTYYGYNLLGQLAVVISPEGSASLSATAYPFSSQLICDFAYTYLYDGLGNVSEKKQPGKEAEYFVYDKANRLVMNQDGNLRKNNQWIYFVYDNLNRLAEQNLVSGTLSHAQLQNSYNNVSLANSYPYFNGKLSVETPFGSSDFNLVKKLSTHRYSGYKYVVSGSEKTQTLQLASDKFVAFDQDYYSNWGASSLDTKQIYFKSDGTIKSEYYICEDPSNPAIQYFYIPQEFIQMMSLIISVEPNPMFNFIDSYPGEETQLTSVTINKQGSIETTLFNIPPTLAFEAVTGIVSGSDKDEEGCSGREIYQTVDQANNSRGIIERAYYYDDKGRVIQIVEKNPLGGISRTSTRYDFVGNVLAVHESHQYRLGATAPDIKLTICTYDARGRLLTERTTLNSGTAATVTYGYDELGKLASKSYGNGVVENLAYNLQGWQTNQSVLRSGSSLYQQQLCYYNPVKGSTPLYSGNISEWSTSHGGQVQNTYGFTYDPLGRLLQSNRYEGASTSPMATFTERGITYDRNGNITALQRYTSELADNFTYGYSGNKLTTLSGSVNASYTYDNNGNMTKDGRKNLDISYNLLNLPSVVSQSGSTKATYTYLADGSKVQVADASGNGFAYLGSLIYTKSGSGYTLESAGFSSGRIQNSSGTLTPYYHTTDHLGSVRMITNGSGGVVEQNDYFPFGGKHTSGQPYSTLAANRYKFNGKEEQTVGGLSYLDYGARMYDNVLGRWMTQDPLGEKYYGHSPYNFCGGNPILRIDKDGKAWDIFWDVANVVYDAGAAVYNHIKGDHKTAKSYWADAGYDLVAAAIPFVPAGASKLVKGAKALDKVNDSRKVVKNADEIAEGLLFEKDQLAKTISEGKNVSGRNRLVPQNGKGNIKGNRTDTDQLIKHDDGTYSIIETKRTPFTRESPGQKAAREHVEKGNGMFEVRTERSGQGLIRGEEIQIKEYKRINKYE